MDMVLSCTDINKSSGGMVLNVTFNNISAISWCSVLLVEETGIPGENRRPRQVTDKLKKSLGARQSKEVNRIVKIGYGQLFLRDEP
jgi:hypothetical protein